MKTKEVFRNMRLERMREKLQQYDFEIKYKKGEDLGEADTIRRIFEEPNEYIDFEKRNKKLTKDNESNKYWKVSMNKIKQIPKIREQKILIKTFTKIQWNIEDVMQQWQNLRKIVLGLE